jgi:hypothetical protein
MQVGFSVDPEKVIVSVSTFSRTFEDIRQRPAEFQSGFTGQSHGLIAYGQDL